MEILVNDFYAINRSVGFAVGSVLYFSCEESMCFNSVILSRNSLTTLGTAVVTFSRNYPSRWRGDQPSFGTALLGIMVQLHIEISERGWLSCTLEGTVYV